MKYYEVIFTITPLSEDTCDIVAALAGEAGFESFETCDDGLRGYVQQQLFDPEMLKSIIDSCPFPGLTVSYTVKEAENRNWNAEWEQKGFEPICLPLPSSHGNGHLVIHDGRHMDNLCLLEESDRIEVEIDTHQAFGTGNHETTRMMCNALLDFNLKGCNILDCGTGTGILAITALKLGAESAVGYDIDEWAVDNARHNAVINNVDDSFTILHGDASVLNNVDKQFDIVVANINRNILLADMQAYTTKMVPGASLLLSGFYTEDITMLTECANALQLHLVAKREDNNWACLRFAK